MLKPVRLALVAALVLGSLQLFGSLSSPLALLGAVVLFVAAFGLWRNNVWCGFGPALWLAVQAVSALIVGALYAKSLNTAQLVTVLIGALISVLGAWIFYRAGQALAAAGSQAWFAGPWIAWSAVNLALGIGVLFLQPYVMPTGAMEDTLLIDDHILMPRSGGSVPSRGDVIVLRYPVDPRQTFVKRVVGVPGDRIHIVNKQLYVDGRKLEELYAAHKSDYIDSYRDNFPSEPNVGVDRRALDMLQNHVSSGEVVVPANSYFVLGDNRDSSLDSRYWGFVPRDNVMGKPWIVYWSIDSPAALSGEQPGAWASFSWDPLETHPYGDSQRSHLKAVPAFSLPSWWTVPS